MNVRQVTESRVVAIEKVKRAITHAARGRDRVGRNDDGPGDLSVEPARNQPQRTVHDFAGRVQLVEHGPRSELLRAQLFIPVNPVPNPDLSRVDGAERIFGEITEPYIR